MATENKDFKVKNGLLVGGPTNLVNYSSASPLNPFIGQIWVDLEGDFPEPQPDEYLSLIAASALYLNIVDAENTYLPISASSTFASGDYDPIGSASAAEFNAKAYADSLAPNYDSAGSASAAQTAAQNYADTQISNLVDSAPETLNTLNELAAALGDDANFAASTASVLAGKLNSSTASTLYMAIGSTSNHSVSASSINWNGVTNKPDPVVGVNLLGDITGAASATLTDLNNGQVTINTTVAPNSVALGTDTTGNYLSSISAGNGVVISGTPGEGWTATVSLNSSASVSWNNVSSKPDPIIGVNIIGDVTGAASATLTDLTNGQITINSNIASNSVALGTDTTGNYVAGATAGNGITISGTAGEGWSPTIAINSSASINWANVNNKPDPTITLGGDLTGSITLTDLAGGTLTAAVVDDSHNHIISNVDGLQTALDAKAPLASASLTGIPTAPTATPGTNTTQIATTEFVQGEIGSFSSVEMSPTEPSDPQNGTLWVDTDSNIDILNVEDYLRKDSASSLYSPLTITEVEKTTDFSLSLTDSGKLLRVNSSSAITVTVPVNASAAFVTGTTILLYRAGTGAVSISSAAGVTINSINSASAISGQYGQVSLIKRDTNEWLLAGNIE